MTGTFDNWTKSEQLEKVGDVFQKTIKISDGSKKVHYKVGKLLIFLGVHPASHSSPHHLSPFPSSPLLLAAGSAGKASCFSVSQPDRPNGQESASSAAGTRR